MTGSAPKLPLTKRFWRSFRVYLVRNPLLVSAIAWLIATYLRVVRSTNRLVHDDGPVVDRLLAEQAPLIFTCWHGQHFVIPFLTRNGEPSAMMVSRSADAELNARIVEQAGITVMRGSGGRAGERRADKGGARALLALRNALSEGRSVAFIADVPKGTPREAGNGIVTLAKISGRPVIPIAYATSRRHVFQKAWDKATLNLPFGKGALLAGEPVAVPADADDKVLEEARLLLQRRLNEITTTAYNAVDVQTG